MQRVLVLGCSGAGKSVFALRLAAIIDLPVVHLDQHYWNAGWIETERAAWLEKVATLIAEPEWIMDGNHGGTLAMRLQRADTALFLDYSTWLCLWRALKRIALNLGRSRPDMANGCPERFDWEFVRYVLSFRRRHRRRVMEALKDFSGDVATFESPRDAERYLDRLSAVRGSIIAVRRPNGAIFRDH